MQTNIQTLATDSAYSLGGGGGGLVGEEECARLPWRRSVVILQPCSNRGAHRRCLTTAEMLPLIVCKLAIALQLKIKCLVCYLLHLNLHSNSLNCEWLLSRLTQSGLTKTCMNTGSWPFYWVDSVTRCAIWVIAFTAQFRPTKRYRLFGQAPPSK